MDNRSAALRRGLVELLRERGHESQWLDGFETVPREGFVDRFTVPQDGDLVSYDLGDPMQNEPALAAVYGDHSLLTQWNRNGTSTSASSRPSLMAAMLEALQARPGHTVLELGTGTGYHAALLCHVLGDDAVTTIDVDPGLVAAARDALAAVGHRPAVRCGDGALGVADRAPYDRIIATCGLQRVPVALVKQLAPLGVLVAPISLGLAVLHAQPEGGVLGRFIAPAAFQAHRTTPSDTELSAHQLLAVTTGAGERRYRADPLPRTLLHEPALRFLLELVHPAMRWLPVSDTQQDGATVLHSFDPSRNSWTRAELGEREAEVVACGATDLYGLVHELVQWWLEHGRPDVERFGLSVRADGTHELWLDDPAGDSRVLPA